MKKTLVQRLKNFVVKTYIDLTSSSLKQEVGQTAGEAVEPDPAAASLLRRAAAEGAVLLENDGTLPLKGKFALFGRCQIDTFYAGYGSGGDVHTPYHVCILDGLKRANAPLVEEVRTFYEAYCGAHPADHGTWGDWAYSFEEPAVPEDVLAAAAAQTDVAVVVIGRAAGEDRDNVLEEGSYFSTAEERRLLGEVTARFSRVVVLLNVGQIVDFSWLKQFPLSAVLLTWLGGCEAGNAAADLLLGKVSPSGRLPATVARSYEAYPSSHSFGGSDVISYDEGVFVGYRHFETHAKDDVLWPFGYGLSYTRFRLTSRCDGGKVFYRVENAGEMPGRTVVEVYVEKPHGTLPTPARELIGFKKTALLAPGEAEEGTVCLKEEMLAAVSEEALAYVLLGGTYRIYVGFDVRSADMVASFELKEKILRRFVSTQDAHLKERILRELPAPLAPSAPVSFADVAAGRAPCEDFVASLTEEELIALSRGDFTMDSPLGASGNAGVFGGVTPSLRERGIPPVTAVDGPSGVRLRATASLVPVGTLLSATFDEDLVFDVYALLGRECSRRHADVLLAPALNLQRDPLCGRNFEYFSEDPYLSGMVAASAVRGVQSTGIAACPKHFACNNREYHRNRSDSRLSERTLREIYLRSFEICVKEGKPRFLMTSYNLVNGIYAHYHYPLVRGVLRGEWGFEGCVVTDWWLRRGRSPHFRRIRNNAYRIRAGVNVLMPGGSYVGKGIQYGGIRHSLGKREGLTLAELQRNAAEVLTAVAHLPVARREDPQR